MKVENINGALPQKVAKVKIAETLTQSAVNELSTDKEKKLAKAIIDTVFQKIDDYSDYTEELNVKQIDLILGRTESLLDEKLSNFSDEEKNNVKEELNDSLDNADVPDNIDKDEVKKIFSEVLKTKAGSLKESIAKFFKSKSEKEDKESSDKNKKEPKPSTKSGSDIGKSKKIESDPEKEKKKKDKKTEKDEQKEKDKENSDIRTIVQEELGKLYLKIQKLVLNTFSGFSSKKLTRTIKEHETVLMRTMQKIQKSLLEIINFFQNIGSIILHFLESNIIKLAFILSKALLILFLPILGLFWLTIGPPLLLIAAGIFLILKAVSKNLPMFQKPLTKMMDTISAALPAITASIPGIIDIGKSIVSVINKIITFKQNELWPFFKDKLWPFIKDEVWPFIRDFIYWLRDDVYPNIIKPMLVWLNTTFRSFIERTIMPVIGKILNWITDKLIPFINKHVAPVIKTILSILNEFLNAIKPWIMPLVTLILKTVYEILKVLAPVVTELVTFLANVFMDLIKGIKAVYDNVKNIITKLWTFWTEVLPNFGTWLWGKIKSILPWGEDEKEVNVDNQNTDGWDLQKFQTENDKLRQRIKDLTNSKNSDKLIQDAKKDLNKQRDKIIKVDKGTVFDLVKLVNQMDSYIREILGKTVTILESITDYFSNGMMDDIVTNAKDEAVSEEIKPQLTTNTSETIKKLETHSTEFVKDVEQTSTVVKEEAKTEIKKEEKRKTEDTQSIREFLSDNFGKIWDKLKDPVEVPMPIFAGGTNPKNQASMENI